MLSTILLFNNLRRVQRSRKQVLFKKQDFHLSCRQILFLISYHRKFKPILLSNSTLWSSDNFSKSTSPSHNRLDPEEEDQRRSSSLKVEINSSNDSPTSGHQHHDGQPDAELPAWAESHQEPVHHNLDSAHWDHFALAVRHHLVREIRERRQEDSS